MTKVIINGDISKGIINKNIYGHFAEHLGRCIYEGIWVGEDSDIPNTNGIRNDVLQALKDLQVPVLRWPGGCFADEYHWKDGVGPREQRPKMVNTHWGGVVENNHFGTHEFMELCELIGAEPYICGNVGSGTVQEMAQWIEYITFDGDTPMANWRKENGREKPWKFKYFGIGNESWGCGGNMRPEYYADLFRRYATYVRNFRGNNIYRIACGASDFNYRWTEVLMREAGYLMDGLSLHYYTIPGTWENKGSATEFDEQTWFITLKKTLVMDELITRHGKIMDQYDPQKRVGLIIDEWGAWYDVEPGTNPGFLYQQNTLRDALIAGINFNIFHKHCERVQMTNIAQTINVLQAIILTDGAKMIKTPTYHVFDMYKVHQDAEALEISCDSAEYRMGEQSIPEVSVSASRNQQGQVHISLCNLNHAQESIVEIDLRGLDLSSVNGTVLTADQINTYNDFDNPDAVEPKSFNDAKLQQNKLVVTLPSKSVVVLALQ